METVGHELVLQVVEVMLQRVHKLVEGLGIGGQLCQVDFKIFVQMICLAPGDDLGLVVLLHRGVQHLVIVVGGLGQVGEVPVETGDHDRWGHVGYHLCTPTSLGLASLGDVVHDVGVYHGQVLDQYGRPATIDGYAALLSRGPLLGAVLAQVDDEIRAKIVLEPEVEGDVLVMGRNVLVVIKDGIVLEPSPRGLGREDYVPEGELGDHEVLAALVLVDHDLSGSRPPPLGHLVLLIRIEGAEPSHILVHR